MENGRHPAYRQLYTNEHLHQQIVARCTLQCLEFGLQIVLDCFLINQLELQPNGFSRSRPRHHTNLNMDSIGTDKCTCAGKWLERIGLRAGNGYGVYI